MILVFDLDNTLADEFGSTARPGIHDLLGRLLSEGHSMILWTNSTRARAEPILREHSFNRYFVSKIFREDYDPECLGKMKDIRTVSGDVLIDDDPDEIRFVVSLGKKGVLVNSFRKGKSPPAKDIESIYTAIQKSRGILQRIFG